MVNPKKLTQLREMFPQLDSDEATTLLEECNGNVQRAAELAVSEAGKWTVSAPKKKKAAAKGKKQEEVGAATHHPRPATDRKPRYESDAPKPKMAPAAPAPTIEVNVHASKVTGISFADMLKRAKPEPAPEPEPVVEPVVEEEAPVEEEPVVTAAPVAVEAPVEEEPVPPPQPRVRPPLPEKYVPEIEDKASVTFQGQTVPPAVSKFTFDATIGRAPSPPRPQPQIHQQPPVPHHHQPQQQQPQQQPQQQQQQLDWARHERHQVPNRNTWNQGGFQQGPSGDYRFENWRNTQPPSRPHNHNQYRNNNQQQQQYRGDGGIGGENQYNSGANRHAPVPPQNPTQFW